MIDLTEIKKLPDEEKLRVIEELAASMEEKTETSDDFDDELLKEMERRLEDMRSGKDLGYTWEEAKAMLLKEINTSNSVHA